MNLETTITIKLDVTPRLESMISAIASCFGQSVKTDVPAPTTQAATEEPAPKKKAKAKVKEPAPTPEPSAPAAEESAPQEAEAPVEEHTEEVSPEPPADKPITDDELRKAIRECRERILNGQNDPILRSTVTNDLREWVHAHGVDSSTKLPIDLRPEFVAYCKTYAPVEQQQDNAPF